MAAKSESRKKDITTMDALDYNKIVISCACGAEFDSGSTNKAIRVDICSKCHPFFTGDNRIVDAGGRVEKFKKKYNLS